MAGRGEVVCGDFLRAARGLSDRRFRVIIADPPYNIGKDFGNDSDKRPLGEYLAWTDEWVRLCLSMLDGRGILYVYGFSEILARISARHPLGRQRWLVWHYRNKTVPGSQFWQRSHESILALWNGKRPSLRINQIREEYSPSMRSHEGKMRKPTKGRFSSADAVTPYRFHEDGALPRDVLKVPALAGGGGHAERWFLCRDCGGKVFSPAEAEGHEEHDILRHPTQKPLALSNRLLLSAIEVNGEGEALFPFAGSGSECVAAWKQGIPFTGVEINPEYARLARGWLARLRTGGDSLIL